MDKKALVVEDSRNLAETIIQFLELNHILCDYAENGERALNLVERQHYQVIISDLDMPRMNGLDLCESLRKRGVDTPFIMLTAYDGLTDKLLGFDSGADDYLTKPFEMRELLARVKALSLRRSGQVNILHLKPLGLMLNIDEQSVSHQEKTIGLTRSSWLLFEILARRYPNAVSYQELQFCLWGDDPPDSNSLKVYLHRLRKEIETLTDVPVIKTVKGHGAILRKSGI